jgi:predicted RNA polymerase sigma factor
LDGQQHVGSGEAPGRYQILVAINAVHTSARNVRDTDWPQVIVLYDQLVRLDSSPIIALNRAAAVAELDGRRWHWQLSTALRPNWPAITPATRAVPACCDGWATVTSHAQPKPPS